MADQWWPATWSKLTVGDLVQAPDGSEWEINAIIEQRPPWGVITWTRSMLLRRGERLVWSDRPSDGEVSAQRPPGGRAGDISTAVGLMNMAGLDTAPVE